MSIEKERLNPQYHPCQGVDHRQRDPNRINAMPATMALFLAFIPGLEP